MVDLDAYFRRIGYDGPRDATFGVFSRLHALHPAAIPFENLDPLRHRPVEITPEAVDAKLIGGRRGGYCFEHNSLFRRVLTALGFDVTGLAARVRWNMPDDPVLPRTHMVLRIELDGASWLADVGFGGCVLTAPLRLEPGLEQPTAHDTYRLSAIPGGVTQEVLRDGEWRPICDVSFDPCAPADYEMANWFTSTHPQSHFRHNLLAALTTDQARYGLFNDRLTVRPVGGAASSRMLDAAGVAAALAEVFGLEVEADLQPAIARVLLGAEA